MVIFPDHHYEKGGRVSAIGCLSSEEYLEKFTLLFKMFDNPTALNAESYTLSLTISRKYAKIGILYKFLGKIHERERFIRERDTHIE